MTDSPGPNWRLNRNPTQRLRHAPRKRRPFGAWPDWTSRPQNEASPAAIRRALYRFRSVGKKRFQATPDIPLHIRPLRYHRPVQAGAFIEETRHRDTTLRGVMRSTAPPNSHVGSFHVRGSCSARLWISDNGVR